MHVIALLDDRIFPNPIWLGHKTAISTKFQMAAGRQRHPHETRPWIKYSSETNTAVNHIRQRGRALKHSLHAP